MGARYVGGDYDNSISQLPSYMTFDSQVAYDFKQHSKLFVRVNNLSDHQYVSTAYQGGYYPAVGRSLIFGLSVGF
jgi:outer membrane receptor protein involved in Fe transport